MDFYDKRDYSNSLLTLSKMLSIAIICTLPLSLLASLYVLNRNSTDTTTDSFDHKFGTLTEGLNLSTVIGRNWNILLMTRWFLTNLILVTQKDSPVGQIFILLSISVLVQGLIIYGKPLENERENHMGLFNEAMVSAYLYTMLSLTEFNLCEQELKDTMGMGLLVVVLVSFFVNMLKLLYVTGILMKKRVIPKIIA